MTIGSKIKIKAYDVDAFVGRQGVIEGIAPDLGHTLVFKVRVGDMILPGWFREPDLEELPRPYTTLIFDLDGTLTDSSEGILRSIQYALSMSGIEEPDLQKLRPFLVAPIEETFTRLYNLSNMEARTAMAHYQDRYLKKGIFEQTLYPGIPDLLKQLKSDGYRLAVGTSRSMKHATTILRFLDIQKFFDAVGAKDEEGCLRSKADVLNSLLGYMGLSSAKSTCVFIGDSRRDIEEARQAGIPTIAAAWGYGTKQDLRNAGATHIVDNLQGFKGLL